MIVYYFETTKGKFGSLNEEKIIKMAGGNKIGRCPISEFVGTLMSSEYIT